MSDSHPSPTIRRRLAPIQTLLMVLALAAGLIAAAPTEQASAAGRIQLKVSIANVGKASKPPVGAVLDKRNPQVMVISEAYRARAHLKNVAERKGYKLRQYGSEYGEQGNDVALLIRDDVSIRKVRPMKMSKPWWFNGNKHQPRVYPAAVITSRGKTWHLIGVHFPPGGPNHDRNAPAWRESKIRIQRYAANHGSRPVVVAGDFNGTADELRRHFPGFAVKKGGKVDHTISKKGRGTAFGPVSNDNRDSRPGHGWWTFRVTRPS